MMHPESYVLIEDSKQTGLITDLGRFAVLHQGSSKTSYAIPAVNRPRLKQALK